MSDGTALLVWPLLVCAHALQQAGQRRGLREHMYVYNASARRLKRVRHKAQLPVMTAVLSLRCGDTAQTW